MISGIHHTALATGQLDRMVDFYCEGLGFEVVYRSGWERGSAQLDELVGLDDTAARTAMLRSGGAFLEMFEFSSPEGRPGDPDRPVCDHGYTHVCLAVSDIDSEYQRLSRSGMRFHCAPHPAPEPTRRGAVRSVYGRDPDGNVIELLELLDLASPLHLARLAMTGGETMMPARPTE
jgi:catechol 2,3-dioxygenase-like lactoylglutathione lyase family enzyme